VTIAIDGEKHNKERGWNGGLSSTTERWESNLTAADPLTGEIKKSVHLSYTRRNCGSSAMHSCCMCSRCE
jgi:hypothetical protein